MKDRPRTLLLEANGTHWVAVCLDTLGQGLFSARSPGSRANNTSRTFRKLFGDRYADAGYMADWREAFCDDDQLDVEVCNITNLLEFRASRPRIKDYDLVVILHSAAGDRMAILNRTASWFQGRRGKLAMFIGNEYDQLEEKIAFARNAGVDYLCTQLPIDTARQLYVDCPAQLVAMPHALNPRVYFRRPEMTRETDVGFIGDLYERLIGDTERTDIVKFFAGEGETRGLRCDIRAQRMPREEWALFLNQCRTVVGAESGTYFLERDSRALKCAKDYLRRAPAASFSEVFEHCFASGPPTLNGKAISSRHFEPIGTNTCQVLIEGAYNGILEPDVHYMAVKRDLSNIDAVIDRMKDPQARNRVTDAAYTHAIDSHTYGHRVRHLTQTVFDSFRPMMFPAAGPRTCGQPCGGGDGLP
jgi:hypothetical protein